MALQRRFRTALAPLALLLIVAACGDDDAGSSDDAAVPTTTAAVDEAESPYCRTALGWQVHELTPVDDSDPTALEAYMTDFGEFTETAANQAPDAIADQWVLVEDTVNNDLIPTMARYDFDGERFEAEATAEEQALLDEPPPEVGEAQDAIHEYEALTCGAGQPAAADVEFSGSADSAYCEATATLEERNAAAFENGPDPEAFEAFATSDDTAALFATGVDEAPEDIADDVAAVQQFVQEQQLPLFEAYDFDVSRILLEASADERAVLQYTSPEIVDQFTRTSAYDEQVCGLGGEG